VSEELAVFILIVNTADAANPAPAPDIPNFGTIQRQMAA
jgi:hypothetical protein